MTKPRYEMPITIRGITYKNAREAAAAVGVKRSTIYSAIYRNTLDTVGLGTGARTKWAGGTPKPISFGGKHFPSLRAMSLYLGLKRGTLSKTLRVGKERAIQNLIRRMMERTAKEERKAVKDRVR